MTEPLTRGQLLRWTGWFAMANAVVLGLVGLRYFSGFSGGGTVLSWIYLLLIYPGHHVLLALGPLIVVLAPLILLRPSRALITGAGVVLMALIIAVIMLDSLLWSESRFHINALTLQILGWQSWVFSLVIFLIALMFESMLASRLWLWVKSRSNRHGKSLALLSVAAVLGAQLIYAWADASYYVPVTSVGQQLPVYKGFTAKRRLVQLGLVDPQASREREVAKRLSRQLGDRSSRVLNYPARPLQCSQDERLNVLLIMADAMRSDMLNEQTSPRLVKWAAQRGQVFTEHFSGGNSSRMGVFSLFYGLPPGYWSTFESMQRSSVLIDEFQRQGFQLGLFSSATMYRPVTLDRTAFANVQDLRLETEPADAPSWKKDAIMTQDWWGWLDNWQANPETRRESDAPFFGFLFYNSTNAMVYPEDMMTPAGFDPVSDDELAQRFSNYRKSVYYVDELIDQVLRDLDKRALLDHTVVVITSDHGEEFDESGAGLKNHGSGYSRYQLQVPMVVLWPGKAPRVYAHRTSHYDLVPTLMQEVLGCSNPPADYASGSNLFSDTEWDWLLAGSYYNYAVLEPDQITITFPNGRYEVRDWNYKIMARPEIRGEVLQAVTTENARFYR